MSPSALSSETPCGLPATPKWPHSSRTALGAAPAESTRLRSIASQSGTSFLCRHASVQAPHAVQWYGNAPATCALIFSLLRRPERTTRLCGDTDSRASASATGQAQRQRRGQVVQVSMPLSSRSSRIARTEAVTRCALAVFSSRDQEDPALPAVHVDHEAAVAGDARHVADVGGQLRADRRDAIEDVERGSADVGDVAAVVGDVRLVAVAGAAGEA